MKFFRLKFVLKINSQDLDDMYWHAQENIGTLCIGGGAQSSGYLMTELTSARPGQMDTHPIKKETVERQTRAPNTELR